MNDEQVVLTLPDTQNADSVCLTQSQELSQKKNMTVWGRLCPIKLPFKTMGKYTHSFHINYDLPL